MGKIAFVFPGQGAQHSGMGRDLTELSPAAKAVFQTLEATMPGISRLCFSGSEEELRQTKNTQPALFAVELAAAAALREAGIRAEAAAGFSLGELAALTYGGAFSLEEGFRAVIRRGQLMQEAAEAHPAAMAAVLKLSPEQVTKLRGEFRAVYPVNFNCPGQISVAGDAEEMPLFRARVKAEGGRAVPLKVSGGFHCPFMASASEAFGEFLTGCQITGPEIPVYGNRTGLPYGAEVRQLLTEQISSPVQWEKTVRNMIADGVDTFIELGPGQVLSGLIRKTDSTVRCLHVEDMESLNTVISEVQAC